MCQCLVPPPGTSINHRASTRVLLPTMAKSIQSERKWSTGSNINESTSSYLLLLSDLYLLTNGTVFLWFDVISTGYMTSGDDDDENAHLG
mmetsp:Transcript_112261/g.194949  ORF Transcript_112261/g.194949 Transcript_112261/m.194949 type:complete len:90 (+) Transcript_112261:1525-1794(+)